MPGGCGVACCGLAFGTPGPAINGAARRYACGFRAFFETVTSNLADTRAY
jgi:hypothetical protein